MSRPIDVFAAYTQQGWTLSLAESCTGGMVAAAVTEVAGSSNIFGRGFVTYSDEAKTDLLGVSDESLRLFGAVSEEVASEMAAGAKRSSGADVAVAITGIAGPGGSENKPEGRVCFALLAPGKDAQTETVEFGAMGRAEVRTAARDHALSLLLSAAS